MTSLELAKRFPHVGRDVLASIVVFLVALPLCVGIAIASGVPPERGLVTGIIGGLVVGMLAGAPLQVSGPAAGLAVLIWQLVEEHGLALLGPLVLLAGAIQIAAGVLRIGTWFRAVSPGVILGMLAGIGVLIAASQLHVLVDDSPRGSGILNITSIPQAIYKGLIPMDGSPHHLAATVGVVTLIVIVGWMLVPPKRLRMFPAPLVGVIMGTVVTAAFGFEIRKVDVPDSLAGALAFPSIEAFGQLFSTPALLGAAVALAVIASAETLLCATAVDRLHDGERTRYDRELLAQGVGNTLCGMVGALPMTGVIVRSTANVGAGAKTRLSAVLHGAWLLAFVAFLPAVLEMIPMAALAAVLVYTGAKLANPAQLVALWQRSRSEALVAVVTLGLVVAVDLLTGVVAGFALSVLAFAVKAGRVHVVIHDDAGAARAEIRGIASFLSLPRLTKLLDELPTRINAVDVTHAAYVDAAAREVIDEWHARRLRMIATSERDTRHATAA